MEQRYGHSFSHVRVHDGAEGDRVAREHAARAVTRGSDLFFRAGQFAPYTPFGAQVIAHELAHVVQQSPNETTHITAQFDDRADAFAESEAHQAAIAALGSHTADVSAGSVPHGTPQLWPWDDEGGSGSGITSTISGAFDSLTGGGVTRAAQGIVNTASDVGRSAFHTASDVANTVVDTAGNVGRSVVHTANNVGKSVVDTATTGVNRAVGAATRAATLNAGILDRSTPGHIVRLHADKIQNDGALDAATQGATLGAAQTIDHDAETGSLGLGTLGRLWSNERERENKAASLFSTIQDGIDSTIEWGEDATGKNLDWAASKFDGIPVLGTLAHAGASVGKGTAQVAGGFDKALTGAVTGIGEMAMNPLGTAEGLYNNTWFGSVHKTALQHELAVMNGDETVGEAAGGFFSRKTAKDAFEAQGRYGEGLIKGYRDSYDKGRYGEMGGRGIFDVGSLVLGGEGEAGAAGEAGEAAEGSEATRVSGNPAYRQAGPINIPPELQNAEGGFDPDKYRAAGSPKFGLDRKWAAPTVASDPAYGQAGKINIPPELQNAEGGFDPDKYRTAGSPKFGLDRKWAGTPSAGVDPLGKTMNAGTAPAPATRVPPPGFDPFAKTGSVDAGASGNTLPLNAGSSAPRGGVAPYVDPLANTGAGRSPLATTNAGPAPKPALPPKPATTLPYGSEFLGAAPNWWKSPLQFF